MKPNSLGMASETLSAPASAHLFSHVSHLFPTLAHPLLVASVLVTQNTCPSLHLLSPGHRCAMPSSCKWPFSLKTQLKSHLVGEGYPQSELSRARCIPSEQLPCHHILFFLFFSLILFKQYYQFLYFIFGHVMHHVGS